MLNIFMLVYMTVVRYLMLVVYENGVDKKQYKFKINLHLFLMNVFSSVSSQACDKYGFEDSRIPRLLGGLWSSGKLWSRTLINTCVVLMDSG